MNYTDLYQEENNNFFSTIPFRIFKKSIRSRTFHAAQQSFRSRNVIKICQINDVNL